MDKKKLIKKIEKLPQEHSIVLSHILIEELSYKEVAEIMSCSELEVRQLFDEALLMLSDKESI